MTRVAAIDCGTNSIRLLIADRAVADRAGAGPDGAGELIDVDRRTTIVRLGQDVDRTGRLAPEAIERTRIALTAYAEAIRSAGVERVRMVATSATRDAANRDDFHAMVRDVLGQPAEIITGAEEASLSFAGAVGSLHGHRPPYLVLDIGGGSTEFVLGRREVTAARSVDIGSVRLTERHFADDPPTRAQVERARADALRSIEQVRAEVPIDTAATVVGVAGSVTTIAAVALGLTEYDRNRVDGAVLEAEAVRRTAGRLLAAGHDERAALTVIAPGRRDVIAAGALILRTIIDACGADAVVVSEHDILDGIALSLGLPTL